MQKNVGGRMQPGGLWFQYTDSLTPGWVCGERVGERTHGRRRRESPLGRRLQKGECEAWLRKGGVTAARLHAACGR